MISETEFIITGYTTSSIIMSLVVIDTLHHRIVSL